MSQNITIQQPFDLSSKVFVVAGGARNLGCDGIDLKGAEVFLASEASAYVTGHNLVVDGGFSIWQ